MRIYFTAAGLPLLRGDSGRARSDAPPGPQGGLQGEEPMTPPLLRSPLGFTRGAAAGAAAGGLWPPYLREQRSQQESGAGAEARVRRRCRGRSTAWLPAQRTPGRQRLRRRAEGAAAGGRDTHLLFTWTRFVVALVSPSAVAAPGRRRRSSGSREWRVRRAQDVLSHAAPAARLELLWEPAHPLSPGA